MITAPQTFAARAFPTERLAATALAQYALRPTRVEVLQNERHLVLGVRAVPISNRAPSRQATPQRFVLRIHRPGLPPPAVTRSQFHWLRAIRRDTDLIVPDPVANRAGDDVTPLRIDGLPARSYCTLTLWVDGQRRFRPAGPGPRAMRSVGRLMARLHLHGQHVRLPSRFRCPWWDWDGLFGPSSPWYPTHPRHLDPPTQRLFHQVMQKARAAMDQLGTGPDTFGLIHGDLTQANYLFHHRQARAIDFGDFGRGYFLYDLAVTLLMLRPFDRDGRQTAAFLRGYRDIRPLPPGHESFLPTFIAARAVVLSRWIAGAASPTDADLQWVAGTTAWLQQWCAEVDGRNRRTP